MKTEVLIAERTVAEQALLASELRYRPFLAKPADFSEVVACLEQHLGKCTSPR